MLFDRLRAHGGGETLADWYLELEMLVHGGVNFAPCRERFQRLLAGTHAETREVFPASEGFFAIQDRGPGEGMRLLTDRDMVYEFVPVEDLNSDTPTRHFLWEVEAGVNYALVVTTCAGLFAYGVGDTVRFVETDPPRLLVTGRTSYTLSAFGEHLTAEEVETAAARAARKAGITLDEYTVGPVFPDDPADRGQHLFVIEAAGGVPDRGALDAFAEAVDADLMAENDASREHRAGGFGMAPPRVAAVPPGTFAAWMRERGRLGGQNKVPRIDPEGEVAREISRRG